MFRYNKQGALKLLPVQSLMCLKCHVLACKNPLMCAWTYMLNFHADFPIDLEIGLLIHSSICMKRVKEGTKPKHTWLNHIRKQKTTSSYKSCSNSTGTQ